MMRYIDVGDAALRWDLAGAGDRTVVLVHEMGASLESWDEVVPILGTRRRVLRFDWRGSGLSHKLRGTADLDVLSGDIAALLDEAGIAGRVALAGGAVGAAIALNFALRFPARASAVVAMAPATDLAEDRRAALIQRFELVEREGMRALAASGLDASWPPAMREGNTARFEAFRARWLGNDPSSFAAINRMLLGLDLRPKLASLKCPALVLAGRHDHVRPAPVVEAVAQAIPGARVKVIETGHFMPAQTPTLIAGEIAQFLDQVGA